MAFVSRFFSPPEKQSFFLFGPRGTGKSFWIKQTYKEDAYVHVDLLNPHLLRVMQAHPNKLRELIEAITAKHQKVIVIDEVQKCPELLSVVHGLIEEKRSFQFILTGSSSRKLKTAGTDLLAGRAVKRTLHPFLASELQNQFSLNKALQLGMLPLVLAAENSEEVLKNYIDLYIREEIQIEGIVRKIENFSRFLEAISFSHGSILNLSSVARDCEVKRKTVESYIQILEDLLLAFHLSVFQKKAKRLVTSHPKFYFFDTGVFRSLRPSGPLDYPGMIAGPALEGLVIQQIRAWNAYRGEKNTLFYWHTPGGLEVDLVLYGEDGLIAIEIKNTSRIRPEDLVPLQEFKKDYPQSLLLFLYRGEETLRKGHILCLPCEIFLKNLTPFKFFL